MTSDNEHADSIRALEERRQRIERDARIVRDAIDDAETMRRGAMLDAGQLVADVKALKAEHGGDAGIDLVRLSDLTGLSRPTLDKWASVVEQGSSADLKVISGAELARLHAGYCYGGHEHIDAEFWARYPRLAGWHSAYQWLIQQAHDKHVDECTDPMKMLDSPVPQAAVDLRREYRRVVDEIAAG